MASRSARRPEAKSANCRFGMPVLLAYYVYGCILDASKTQAQPQFAINRTVNVVENCELQGRMCIMESFLSTQYRSSAAFSFCQSFYCLLNVNLVRLN